jgi:hypothetical protein
MQSAESTQESSRGWPNPGAKPELDRLVAQK